MNKKRLVAIIFGLLVVGANAADVPTQTCEQIRDEIRSVIGIVPIVDTDLLQKISLRSECQFSSVEVYRAAYGDKPLPKQDTYQRQESHQDDD